MHDVGKFLTGLLKRRMFLWLMIVINGMGSIYGFYWYKEQLAATPEYLRIFVPDSPTASTFFTLVLIAYLFRKSVPTLEAFAAVTSFKYGVWAIAVILAGYYLGDELAFEHYMLMFSHGGMALEALLYARFYSIKFRHIVYVALWTLLNDLLDYLLEIHPWVYPSLEAYHNLLGWATFGLSILSLWLIYAVVKKNRNSI